MESHIWRRHHGREFTANVIVKEPCAHTVAVLHEPSGVLRRLPRTFERLDAAKAAADDFVRRSFSHSCTVESCGEWMIWSA
jgi:hypothetical protein